MPSTTPYGMTLLLSNIPDAKPDGKGGYHARCPAHDDQNPSFGFREGNDKPVVIHCMAGCTADAILAAIGLTWKDLYPPNDAAPRPSKGITLKDLAHDKHLPVDFLKRQGLKDINGGVAIPYRDEYGHEVRTRLRYSLKAKKGSKWGKGDTIIPYGLQRLDRARISMSDSL
jgi:hypothetical protein